MKKSKSSHKKLTDYFPHKLIQKEEKLGEVVNLVSDKDILVAELRWRKHPHVVSLLHLAVLCQRNKDGAVAMTLRTVTVKSAAGGEAGQDIHH